MGVQSALACHKCEKWIDLHKCYGVSLLMQEPIAPIDSQSWPEIENYWGARALWFLWKHKDHGADVEMFHDPAESYWDMTGKYEEIGKHVYKPDPCTDETKEE